MFFISCPEVKVIQNTNVNIEHFCYNKECYLFDVALITYYSINIMFQFHVSFFSIRGWPQIWSIWCYWESICAYPSDTWLESSWWHVTNNTVAPGGVILNNTTKEIFITKTGKCKLYFYNHQSSWLMFHTIMNLFVFYYPNSKLKAFTFSAAKKPSKKDHPPFGVLP